MGFFAGDARPMEELKELKRAAQYPSSLELGGNLIFCEGVRFGQQMEQPDLLLYSAHGMNHSITATTNSTAAVATRNALSLVIGRFHTIETPAHPHRDCGRSRPTFCVHPA